MDINTTDEESQSSEERNVNEIPAETCSKCSKINKKLIPYKLFYFFFFSAVGSLFPYLAIFYKQQQLSARQTGILIGLRPVLQLVSSSVWGIIGDRYGKIKLIFFISLASWLFSNFSLSLVKGNSHKTPCRDNGSLTVFDNAIVAANGFLRNETIIDKPQVDLNKIMKMISKPTIKLKEQKTKTNRTWKKMISKIEKTFREGMMERKITEGTAMGHDPWSLDTILNLKTTNNDIVTQNNCKIFTILLIITIIGNTMAAPTVPFTDTATLQVLGK